MNGEESVEASLEKISAHHNMVYRASDGVRAQATRGGAAPRR